MTDILGGVCLQGVFLEIPAIYHNCLIITFGSETIDYQCNALKVKLKENTCLYKSKLFGDDTGVKIIYNSPNS